MDIQRRFGNIDIYLFDQLLRGRLCPNMKVLDAGCGGGRNLIYLLHDGFDVYAVDHDAAAIAQLHQLVVELNLKQSPKRFVVGPVEAMPFVDQQFDFIICNALLHFARDEDHFHAMVCEMARVLCPGGIFFARLMSTHGVESLIRPLGGRRYLLPGGQAVFLVDEELLLRVARETLQGELLDPLKSTYVHNQRTMTTWVVRRSL